MIKHTACRGHCTLFSECPAAQYRRSRRVTSRSRTMEEEGMPHECEAGLWRKRVTSTRGRDQIVVGDEKSDCGGHARDRQESRGSDPLLSQAAAFSVAPAARGPLFAAGWYILTAHSYATKITPDMLHCLMPCKQHSKTSGVLKT